MLHLTAPSRKKEQGFTLLEIIVVLVIAGVLAAISAPSLLGWYNRNKIEEATAELQGVLRQAQRNAIRESRDCTVTFPPSGTKKPTVSSSCVGDITLDRVTLRHNYSSDITFNYRGGTGSTGTAVLAIPDSTPDQNCVVVAPGIGLIRFGDYSTNDTSGASAANCTTKDF